MSSESRVLFVNDVGHGGVPVLEFLGRGYWIHEVGRRVVIRNTDKGDCVGE